MVGPLFFAQFRHCQTVYIRRISARFGGCNDRNVLLGADRKYRCGSTCGPVGDELGPGGGFSPPRQDRRVFGTGKARIRGPGIFLPICQSTKSEWREINVSDCRRWIGTKKAVSNNAFPDGFGGADTTALSAVLAKGPFQKKKVKGISIF